MPGADESKATRIFTLLKLFDKLEYAQAFCAGQLRLHKLGFFRRYRDANGELRGDPYEGVAGLYQPALIGSVSFRGITIPPEDLAGPILISSEAHQSWSVLCLYALSNAGMEGRKFESLAAMKNAMLLHDRCYGLGAHIVVFTSPNEFLRRLEAKIPAELSFRRSLVSYYDETSFHGNFAHDEVAFRKRKMFEHQREYRIAVKTDPDTPDPLLLDVGDLSDICAISTPEQFNQSLEFVEKSPAERAEEPNDTEGPPR